MITTKENDYFEAKEGLTNLPLQIRREGGKNKYRAGYYIGIDWLTKDIPIIVNPKIKNLDYLKMFIECFKVRELREELNKQRDKGEYKRIYELYPDKKPISPPTLDFEITPLIIIHYLNLLKGLISRGLKRDYIRQEENLPSKIKGKISFAKHLNKNVMFGRKDKVYCKYQEYSIDCLENRILKKAFCFAKRYLSAHNINHKGDFNAVIGIANTAFEGVGELRDIRMLRQVRINRLYRGYSEALRLAKLILQRFSYSIQKTEQQKEEQVMPFYINMPLLFEIYVLAKLREKYGSDIQYQVKGKFGEADYIKQGEGVPLILDAKYKTKYKEDKYDTNDIRQLTGYARDKDILKKLGVKDDLTVVSCMILYPNQDGIEEFTDGNLLNEKKEDIDGFTHFYKLGISYPIHRSQDPQ